MSVSRMVSASGGRMAISAMRFESGCSIFWRSIRTTMEDREREATDSTAPETAVDVLATVLEG